MTDEIAPTLKEIAEHSQLALWQSYCDKKMRLENLTEMTIELMAYLEIYIDECHAEDVVCERELIAKIKSMIAPEPDSSRDSATMVKED